MATLTTRLYAQGLLNVFRTGAGYRVEHGDDVWIDIDSDGNEVASSVNNTRSSRIIREAVVDVVVEAIRRRMRGFFHMHAGAVAVGDGLVLIAGDGGQGKTTTTLALAAAGAVRCGDDVVFVRRGERGVVGAAWARPLHVGPETRRMFPDVEARVVAGLSLAGKAIVDVDGDEVERAVVGVVYPSIDRDPNSLTSATRTTAHAGMVRLLSASAMVTWPGVPRAQEHLDVLAALTALPAIALCLGADALEDPARIAAAVHQALPGSRP